MKNNQFAKEQLEKLELLEAIYFVSVDGVVLYKKDIPVRPDSIAKLKEINPAKESL